MKLIRVTSSYSPDMQNGWRIVFDALVDDENNMKREFEMLGYEITAHAKSDEAYELMRIQTSGEVLTYDTFQHQTYRHWMYIDEPLVVGNDVVYSVDDDYRFRIVEVSELAEVMG